MRTRIIKIGDSQGIHIPQVLLKQAGIHSEVEMEIQGECLTIRAVPCPRKGWDEAFCAMAKQHDDVLLNEDSPTTWDREEWEW